MWCLGEMKPRCLTVDGPEAAGSHGVGAAMFTEAVLRKVAP